MSFRRLIARNGQTVLLLSLFLICCWIVFLRSNVTPKPDEPHTALVRSTLEPSWADASLINIFSHKRVNPGAFITDKKKWLARRQALLSQPSRQRKLALFCVMRGGSTYFSELFRQNPQVMYYYEPFDAFYSHLFGENTWHYPQDIFWYQHEPGNSTLRVQPDAELDAMAWYNRHMLTCNFSNLPVELFFHKGMHPRYNTLDFYSCLRANYNADPINCRNKYIPECAGNSREVYANRCWENILLARELSNDDTKSQVVPRRFLKHARCTEQFVPQIQKCVGLLEEKCTNAKLVTYKGLRLTMESVERMLQLDPDLNVVYLVRDPRGTVLSRVKVHLTYRDTLNDPVLEAKYHCAKMLSDLELYDKLQTKYPGAILLMKYEDITMHPFEEVKRVYEFVDMGVHPTVLQWMKDSEKVSDNGGVFDTTRANATASLNAWRSQVSEEQAAAMTWHCFEVLSRLNYKP